MKTDDGAPFHFGSLSGNICPISGSPNAPNIASTTQCNSTSPANKNYTSIIIPEKIFKEELFNKLELFGSRRILYKEIIETQILNLHDMNWDIFNWLRNDNKKKKATVSAKLPSEWASQPLSCGILIPPIIKGYPGSNRWRSKPWPTLKGKDFGPLLDVVGPSTCTAVVPTAADMESLVVGLRERDDEAIDLACLCCKGRERTLLLLLVLEEMVLVAIGE